MPLLIDQAVDLLVQALNRDELDFDPIDDVEPIELDPVARITPQETATEPIIPDTPTPSFLRNPPQRVYKSPEYAEEAQTFRDNPELLKGTGFRERTFTQRNLTSDQFVRMMLAREGLEYEWGGTSARTGFDCSGIVWKLMQNSGFKNFPRHSADIYAHSKKISVERAKKIRGALLYREGHMEISLGNGKTIGAGSEGTGVRIGTADQFTHGGLLPELKIEKAIKRAKRAKPRMAHRAPTEPLSKVKSMESITSPTAVFGSMLDEMDAPLVKGKWKPDSKVPTQRRGVKGQLYEGFMAAGRPDLAKMVFTNEFDTWIGQESGWVVNRTSGPINQGLRNDGLFQVWRGHDYNSKGQVKKMSAYEQALLVAQNFDLTPEDIRTYAQQVRAGTYKGWG